MRDPVTPEMHEYILRRDKGCVAPRIDSLQLGMCWGRLTLDHVKTDLRMGKRAPSDRHHLVTLCEGHTEAGARAGHQWNTANRPELRDYIALAEGDPGASPVLGVSG